MSAPLPKGAVHLLAADDAADEPCPGCDHTDQVRRTGSTPNTDAWACDGCGLDWAVSLVNPHLPRDYAKQIGAARWILGRVVQLGRRDAEADRRGTSGQVARAGRVVCPVSRYLRSCAGQQ